MGLISRVSSRTYRKFQKMGENILTGKSEAEIQKFTQDAQMMEIRGMGVTYNNLTQVCMKKCMNTRFDSAKLYKGESICLSKCTAKYLEFAAALQKTVQETQEAQIKQYEEMQRQTESYQENKGNFAINAFNSLFSSSSDDSQK